MAMTEEQRSARLRATAEKARHLVEDLAYLREMVDRDQLEAPELRRASALLRRLLVEGDLVAVAGPRLGKLMISSPDLGALHRANDREAIPFAAAAGASLFGVEVATMLAHPGTRPRDLRGYRPDARVQLTMENFLKQRVICLHGEWVTRHQIIRFVANVGSGVHSGAPAEPEERLIHRMRSACQMEMVDGMPTIRSNIDALSDEPAPFVYKRNAIDVVLIELLTTARLIVESPEVARLEALIDAEHLSVA